MKYDDSVENNAVTMSSRQRKFGHRSELEKVTEGLLMHHVSEDIPGQDIGVSQMLDGARRTMDTEHVAPMGDAWDASIANRYEAVIAEETAPKEGGERATNTMQPVAQFSSFAAHLKALQNKTVRIRYVCELGGQLVYQLQLVNARLWALREDRIDVLEPDGSVGRTIKCDFKEARDMCVCGDYLVIATRDTGLRRLTLSSQSDVLSDLDTGKFWSVAVGEHQTVWTVKEDRPLGGVTVYCYDMTSGEQLVKFPTCIKVIGRDSPNRDPRSRDAAPPVREPSHPPLSRAVYCTLLGHHLYISSCSDHCVYVLDTIDGRLIGEYGHHGQKSSGHHHGQQSAGELCRPYTIYSDSICQCVLLMDCGNNRLQIFEPLLKRWIQLKTTGEEYKDKRPIGSSNGEEALKLAQAADQPSPYRFWPRAAAVDTHGQIWIADGHPGGLNKLYRISILV